MSESSLRYSLKLGQADAAEVVEFDADTLYQALARARSSVTIEDAELWQGKRKLFDLRLLQGGVWQFCRVRPVGAADE